MWPFKERKEIGDDDYLSNQKIQERHNEWQALLRTSMQSQAMPSAMQMLSQPSQYNRTNTNYNYIEVDVDLPRIEADVNQYNQTVRYAIPSVVLEQIIDVERIKLSLIDEVMDEVLTTLKENGQ